jgi:signal transduction histidine kinase
MGEERVRFMGKMIAIISHELKNSLATVHETAGLMSDILKSSGDLAGDEEEIRRCADDVSSELDRAFLVIRNLNVFAHSADEPWVERDVGAVLELVAALASYLSYGGRAEVTATGGAAPILTNPMLLGDAVFRILDAAYREGGRDTEITFTVGPGEGGVEVLVAGLGAGGILPEEARPLLSAIGGDAEVNERGGEVRIRLPSAPGNGSFVGRQE